MLRYQSKQTLSTFLRKNNRVLRIAALHTLQVLIQSYGSLVSLYLRRCQLVSDDRQGLLCGLLESKLSTGSSSRLVDVKRPRLETVAKEQGSFLPSC